MDSWNSISRNFLLPCLDPTTGDHRAIPGQGHRWVAWFVWFAPLIEDQDLIHHGNRKFFRRQWPLLVGNWSNLWKFSTIWCYIFVCLKKKIINNLYILLYELVVLNMCDIKTCFLTFLEVSVAAFYRLRMVSICNSFS